MSKPTFSYKPPGSLNTQQTTVLATSSSSSPRSDSQRAGDRALSPTDATEYLLPPHSPTSGAAAGAGGPATDGYASDGSAIERGLTPLQLPSPLQRAQSNNTTAGGRPASRSSARGSGASTPAAQTGAPTLHLGASALGGVTSHATSSSSSNNAAPAPAAPASSSGSSSGSSLSSDSNFTLAPFRPSSAATGGAASSPSPRLHSMAPSTSFGLTMPPDSPPQKPSLGASSSASIGAHSNSFSVSSTASSNPFSLGSHAVSVTGGASAGGFGMLNSLDRGAAAFPAQPTAGGGSGGGLQNRFGVPSGHEYGGHTYVAVDKPLLSSDHDDDGDGGGGGGGGGGFSGGDPRQKHPAAASTYYEQYEQTVNKIRARRATEAAAKAASAGKRSPGQTKRELRIVGTLLALALGAIAIIIFLLYPRIPIFRISQIEVNEMRLWSDGTADFGLTTSLSVSNDNFLSTNVNSIAIQVAHNETRLGATEIDSVKLTARTTNPLAFAMDFGTLSVATFAGLFQEMTLTGGQLTLDLALHLVTSENFRLRNIEVQCRTLVQFETTQVPPTASILATDCQHREQTG